jgi:hypothetical protein
MAFPARFVHEAEDVPVGVLEPRDAGVAGLVDVALERRVRQVVVLEPDALGLERVDGTMRPSPTTNVADVALLVPA